MGGSTSTTTGALLSAGGLGVAENAFVGGDLTVVGITASGATSISDNTASSSSTTGSLTTSGGLGVALDAFVGGAIAAGATTGSTSTTTGALLSAGGLGVAEN